MSEYFGLSYVALGEGVPFLCLPPFPFDRRLFREQGVLGRELHLILPDYPGLGSSALAPEPVYTVDGLADQTLAVMDRETCARAVVLGVSMGGYVAMSLALKAPERIRGLILADTRAEADPPEKQEERRATVDDLRRLGTGVLSGNFSRLFAETTQRQNPALIREYQSFLEGMSAEALARLTLGLASRPDQRAWLPKIQMPVLVLCGEQDKVTPPEGMCALAEAIPGAVFKTIPQAGHLPPLEQPAAFNSAVLDWIRTLPA